jgi:hypothetical protein
MIAKANAVGGLGLPLPNMLTWYQRGENPDDPATGLSWNMAARFVNWLNTSEGYSPAYKFAKQPGDAGYDPNENVLRWTASDAGFNPSNSYRNSLAQYFIPSMYEWHKAAYCDPNANDGAGGYWDYPNGSNSPPVSVLAGTDPNTAVYGHPQGTADKSVGPSSVYLAGGLSPYGVMGMGGNVWESEETDMWVGRGSFTTVRGANWLWTRQKMISTYRNEPISRSEFGASTDTAGFRVASLPEPSAGLLAALGIMALLHLQRSSRRKTPSTEKERDGNQSLLKSGGLGPSRGHRSALRWASQSAKALVKSRPK